MNWLPAAASAIHELEMRPTALWRRRDLSVDAVSTTHMSSQDVHVLYNSTAALMLLLLKMLRLLYLVALL